MAVTPRTYETAITIPVGEGSTTEVINLKFEYCADFNNDEFGFDDVRITATIDPGSRSSGETIEDLLGLAFDLGGSLEGLQIDDIAILEAEPPDAANKDPYTPTYIIDEDGIGDGVDPEPGFNINGGDLRVQAFDASVELSEGGADDGTVQSASFIISSSSGDIDAKALLDGTRWYARLQSTDGGEESSKMFLDAPGITLPPCDDGPPPPPEDDYQGLTPGYWKTHGPAPENSPGGQENDWDNDSITSSGETVIYRPVHGTSALTYDQLIFGGEAESDDIRWDIDPSRTVKIIDDLSVSQALSVQGGGKYELARHSMAAILNSRDEDVNYFASEFDICSWTATVLGGGTAQVGENEYDLQGLATLFRINNELGLEPSLITA